MTTPLVDKFGRVHKDLRISVTDRCNYRCGYCMPEEGMKWLDRSDVLSFEEIERIARVLVDQGGIKSIRLTGGEPTVRARLSTLVKKLADLGVDLAMTTNASTLSNCADELRSAGLRRINISLDSLDQATFAELTARDDLANVLMGIDAAVEAGYDKIKINCVLMAGINDGEIVDFLRLGREKGIIVRFIEFMPLDAKGQWTAERVVPEKKILEVAAEVFDFDRIEQGSSPAARFRYRDGAGEFGIISSVTNPFCESCDRIRLSADGQMRNCLFALGHIDLRALLRGGATDDELFAAMASEVDKKWAGHSIGQVHFIRPSKSMSQLGG